MPPPRLPSALGLALALAALPAPAAPKRNAALQVMAGEGTTEAEAVRVEAALARALAPLLDAKGFALASNDELHAELTRKGIPKDAQHAPSNSPANTALIVHLRERDVELHWMTVLTRDGGQVRLALSALQWHDTETLHTGMVQAPSLEALEQLLAAEAPALLAAALAKFKSTPMPSWWRPQAAPAPALLPPPPPPSKDRLPDGARLAVLDFRHTQAFTTDDARYLSDVVRAAALSKAPRLAVMTRENLLVLLQASGKELADCEGECEVDTGRRIGADAVVSGEVLKFGARFKLSLKLHETRSGRLLAAGVASGATLEELDAEVQARAAELLAGQR